MSEYEARKQTEAIKDMHRAWSRELKVMVPARLEDIDSDGRGRVVNLHDPEIEADHVPIMQLYGGDGYGEEHAHHLPERGYMLCADYPVIDTLDATGLTDGVSHRREHMFMDGIFVPTTFWNDEGSLNSAIEEYLYKHNSGAIRRVTPAGEVEFVSAGGETLRVGNGSVRATQTGGNTAQIDGTGIDLTHSAGHEVSISDNEIRVSFERGDGETVRVDVDGSGATISAPDTNNDQATDPRAEVSVSDDGTTRVDGMSRVGDSDAYRVNRSVLNSDADDPRTYAETSEPVAPIADPTDGTTSYSNPSTTRAEGPIDFAGYELRNGVIERRESDPDPAVTDPTNPAYIPLDEVPVGYQWVNTTDGVFRMWGTAGAPVDIVTL